MDTSRLLNFIAIPAILLFAWLFSSNKKVINWRVIIWGLIIETVFAVFVFVLPIGVQVFMVINNIVNGVLDSATYGTQFVFGRLALGP
mgnify:FL=1